MAELNPNSSTTSLNTVVQNYSVGSENLDFVNSEKETYWYFDKAKENFGYYKKIPQLNRAITALSIWTAGKGYTTDIYHKPILDHITGWGEDSFQQIMMNMIITKKIVGDSFCEIIRDGDLLINLKPISPERLRIVLNSKGIIKRYDVWTEEKWKPISKEKILHLCNERIADETHGQSVIELCKWTIDALHEALTDERMIKHRELALGILYADTDKTEKLNELKTRYAEAVKNGEVLVLPKLTAELRDSGVKPQDRIAWINLLENLFYQSVGVPRVIATSENYTEASSKIGFLTFEPIYTNEQTLLEQDLWNQLGIKVTFNRPPSLSNFMQSSENKNTGQVSIQQNELTPSMVKNE